MEITLYTILTLVTLFFTYMNFSINMEKSKFIHYMSGVLWIALGMLSLAIHYFIPLASDYMEVTKNSTYYQILLALIYGMIGVGILITDEVVKTSNGEEGE